MAINFPSAPANNATYTNPTNGVQYTYSSVRTAWEVSLNNLGFNLSATTESFVANGTQNSFSLSTTVTTTNNSIVTVNGLVQVPVVHYNISGNTLTLNITPFAGSVVEARNYETGTGINTPYFTDAIVANFFMGI